MSKYSACIEKTRENGRSLWENKSEIILVNKKKEELVINIIDGCFVTDKINKRCDFMVQHGVINYYIELKGSGYKQAIKQIANSINMLNVKHFGGKKCQPIIVFPPRTIRKDLIILARKEFDKLVKPGICNRLTIKISPYLLPLS